MPRIRRSSATAAGVVSRAPSALTRTSRLRWRLESSAVTDRKPTSPRPFAQRHANDFLPIERGFALAEVLERKRDGATRRRAFVGAEPQADLTGWPQERVSRETPIGPEFPGRAPWSGLAPATPPRARSGQTFCLASRVARVTARFWAAVAVFRSSPWAASAASMVFVRVLNASTCLPRDVRRARGPEGPAIQLVAEGFRTLRKLREVDVVHEPLLGEHCSVLDTAPGPVCALRDIQRDDVTVEVRIPGPARRVQESAITAFRVTSSVVAPRA